MKRLVMSMVVVAVAYFAVQGGEFSTTDLWKQRTKRRMLRVAIDSLRRNVDSLQALKRQLGNDPALQERVAREVNGMVRGDKELLYRFTDSSSAGR